MAPSFMVRHQNWEKLMRSTRRLMLTAAITSAFALTASTISPARAADPVAPGPVSATMVLVAQGAAAGIGYTWGDGILMFHGHQYHFSVNGAFRLPTSAIPRSPAKDASIIFAT